MAGGGAEARREEHDRLQHVLRDVPQTQLRVVADWNGKIVNETMQYEVQRGLARLDVGECEG